MTDSTSARLMAQMRGASGYTTDGDVGTRRVDEGTRVIQRRMLGEPRNYDSIHEANDTEGRAFEAAVQKRTRMLAEQRVPHPEATAREQLRRELSASREERDRRRTHEAMMNTSRQEEQALGEEFATRAAKPLVSRTPQPGTSVNEVAQIQSRDRVAEKLMAAYYGHPTS
ncbi:hypothetical protein [Streptomyces californicus]|uniref:hypothetical protein n=1 Tax=Streptomyces californicus TaxID=67351 RepID=UPI0033C0BC98